MDIQVTLNQLFEVGDQDQIFSHILRRLPLSYIVSNDSVSRAFADLLSRGSDNEILQVLQSNLPAGLLLSRSKAVDSPGVRISETVQKILRSLPDEETDEEEGGRENDVEEEEKEEEEEVEEDLELGAQSYWQDVQSAKNEKCRIELNPCPDSWWRGWMYVFPI
jgi:hypothetical protein